MSSLLRAAAILASLITAVSFLAFAADRSREGSAGQVRAVQGGSSATGGAAELDAPAPAPRVERRREAVHSSLRELVDDGNDLLVAPFTGLASFSSVWAERLVTTGLVLLVFGLGGLFLANLAPKRRREARDWREATG